MPNVIQALEILTNKISQLYLQNCHFILQFKMYCRSDCRLFFRQPFELLLFLQSHEKRVYKKELCFMIFEFISTCKFWRKKSFLDPKVWDSVSVHYVLQGLKMKINRNIFCIVIINLKKKKKNHTLMINVHTKIQPHYREDFHDCTKASHKFCLKVVQKCWWRFCRQTMYMLHVVHVPYM